MGEIDNSTEQLFLDYLAELDSDGSFDIAELQRRHPARATGLRRMFEEWERVRPLLAGTIGDDSIHASLDERFGLGVDPTVSLPDSAAGGGDDSRPLLASLARRASSRSRYRLVGEIARGGMGVVLRVWDGDLRRHLAMKVILGRADEGAQVDAPPTDARVISRFLEEAQVTGQLDHPAIVPVHELGLSEDGRVYFTMRLVRGRELSEIHELVWAGAEDWNQTRALTVLLRACEAVAFAHSKGVVHRDLKPANVMVGRFGEVYVMDWGLARILGSEDRHDIRPDVDPAILSGVITDRSETPAGDSPLKTMDGDIIGTPAFMAPEQALGRLADIGPHSDVYSLGAMLYHLLARTPPHVRPGEKPTQREVLTRLMVGPPEPLSKLAPGTPQELISICEKAMAREADQRYTDVQALAEDMRAFLENRVVSAYRSGPIVELRKWVQRNRALATSIAAAVFLALGGAVTVAIVQSRSNEKIRLASQAVTLMNSQLIEATGGLEHARLELAAADQRRAKLELDNEATRQQLEERAKELEQSREKLEDLQKELAFTMQKGMRLEEEINSRTQRLMDLEDMFREQERRIEELREATKPEDTEEEDGE